MTAEKIYALVDCNSFFCSCERLFRPELANRPVGVLSNNDGCFVSRTPELKELGVKMGEPYFKVKALCEKHGVAVFSSNFSLYTNISDRVMTVLSEFAPELEVYSVDEAFLNLTGIKKDLVEYAHEIKERVLKYTGIPVSIGIGPTKTLAKIANNIGKKSKKANGVVVLMDRKLQEVALERTEIEDVWGIGRKNSVKLRSLGIKNALEFKNYRNDFQIQKIFTKIGRMTQEELRGIPCFELNTVVEKKKEIMCSRSFGTVVTDLKNLRESIANYATSACEKMRKQGSACAVVEIFCHSDPFRYSEEQYYARDHVKFLTPTTDTRKIIKYAWQVLENLYRLDINYKKAGVRLTSLTDDTNVQYALFEERDDVKSINLMRVIDQINAREGSGTIRSMSCGVDSKSWKMRQDLISPRYVSGWNSLPKTK
ncbi:Y-family DNA polymerase [Bacteriovorax sp. Seq25_V]|uniref:Y-family DNA polymerase n=1 Tax=Bacteriovorax sp. Seq25_V TaxID=1201288 RepID=UPI000389DB8B|nr:Y-family DNA polymerase [Bacteriovorax sp. Seq25_V]EQC47232.1 ImpB/MucB/SamB family protein [Bacteriovorax sp. Seq25_V]